jgi:hypothetical protein
MVDAGLGGARHSQLARDGHRRIPAVSGSYYLKFGKDAPGKQADFEREASLFQTGTRQARGRVVLIGLELVAAGQGKLPFDKRVHFIPEARLIVTLPDTADRLILHRFDPTSPRLKSADEEP